MNIVIMSYDNAPVEEETNGEE
jgi:hypothetical protein